MKKEDTSWVSEKEESPSYHRNIKENLKHRLNLLSQKKKEEAEWDIFYQEEPMFPPSEQSQGLDGTQGVEGFENTREIDDVSKTLPEQLFETIARFIKVFESPDSDSLKESFKEPLDEFDEEDEQEKLRKKIKSSKKGSKRFAPNKNTTKAANDEADGASDFMSGAGTSSSDFASAGEEFEKTGDIKLPSGKGNMFKKLYDLFMIVFKLMGKGGNLIYEYLIYIPEKINEYLDKFSNAIFDAFSADFDEKFRKNDVNIMKYIIWCIMSFLITITAVGQNIFAFCASKASNEKGILHKVDEFSGFLKYTFGLLFMPARHLDRAMWLFAKTIGTLPRLLQYLVVMCVSYMIVSKFSIYEELKAMMKGRNTKFRTFTLIWIFSVCLIIFIKDVMSGIGMLGPAFSLGLIVMMLAILVCVVYVTMLANTMALITGAFLLAILMFGQYILGTSNEDVKHYITLVDEYSDCPEPTTMFQMVIQFLKEYISKPETVHVILFYLLSLDTVINAFNHIKSKDLKITFISFTVVVGLLYGAFVIMGGEEIPQNMFYQMVSPFFIAIDSIKKSFFTPVNPVS